MEFEQVYKKYYSIVYRYLLSLTKDDSMAEEIAQETFYKALKNISKYNPEMKMLTWLCALAKNTYFTELKRQSRHELLEDDIISEESVDGICSEESKREIEEHLKDCESCSKELEMLANFEDIGDDVDEEAAFRKFNNKMMKSNVKKVIVATVVAVAVIALLCV